MPKISEKDKKPGVCYSVIGHGIELPVIDVTNLIFIENASQEELAVLSDDFLHCQKNPAFFRRFSSQHSIAMRGLESARKRRRLIPDLGLLTRDSGIELETMALREGE